MKNWIKISGVLFIFMGCAQQESKENIIPVDKMKVVIWQLMKADEVYTRASGKDSTFKIQHKNVQYYQQIFDLNKVDRVQFYKQMDYYSKHPVDFKMVMDSVNEVSKREKNDITKH
jgi:hypothetical protein